MNISNSYIFIPRNAGFFSVFNYLMGCIRTNMHVYPFFNRGFFLRLNKTNDHFCYFTDSENSWLDYFAPISYFPNDNTHTDIEKLKSLTVTQGHQAPGIFHHPQSLIALRKNNTLNQFRHGINRLFQRYIKLNPDIQKEIDQIQKTFHINESIGVHFRSPSHLCEGGKIYLSQFFRPINRILKESPDSNIFLCTDTQFGIHAFVDEYGDRIKYIKSVDRLTLDDMLRWSYAISEHKADSVGFIKGVGYDFQHQRNKEINNYDITKDLLIDTYCLAACRTIIHTTSNLPFAASYINPNSRLIHLTEQSTFTNSIVS